MNKLSRILLTVFTAGAAQVASAFNYTNSDLLLVFRANGFNDVEFDLGTVSNYLGRARGTVVHVSNFDLSVATNNFGNLNGVKFDLLSATTLSDSLPRIWATDANLAGSPTALNYASWNGFQSFISTVGSLATIYTVSNTTPSYVVSPTDNSSYTYNASESGVLNAANIGGRSPYAVENAIPATLSFYELQISGATPLPAAPLVGRFMMDAAGNLTFVAGAPILTQSQIVGVSRNGSQTSVSFTTTASAAQYRLRYAANPAGPWTTLPTAAAGDGTVQTLTDTTADSARYYSIVTSAN